jgi:hypothetical protein
MYSSLEGADAIDCPAGTDGGSRSDCILTMCRRLLVVARQEVRGRQIGQDKGSATRSPGFIALEGLIDQLCGVCGLAGVSQAPTDVSEELALGVEVQPARLIAGSRALEGPFGVQDDTPRFSGIAEQCVPASFNCQEQRFENRCGRASRQRASGSR